MARRHPLGLLFLLVLIVLSAAGGFALQRLGRGDAREAQAEGFSDASPVVAPSSSRLIANVEPVRREMPSGRAGELPTAPVVLAPKLIDFGADGVEPHHLLVGGVVVDDRGVPQRGVHFWIDPGRDLAPREWREPGEGITEEDGRFRVAGELDVTRLLLQVRSETLLSPEPAPCAVGQEDVRVVVTRPAGVQGTLLLDATVTRSLPTVALRPRAKLPASVAPPLEQQVDFGGGFALSGLWPGHYDVVVRLTGAPGRAEELITLPDLELAPGVVNRDERLQEIDLRGRILPIVVTITDARGELVDDGIIEGFLPGHTDAPVQTVEIQGGRADLVTGGPGLDLDVRSNRGRRTRVPMARGDVHVRLEPSLERVLSVHVVTPGSLKEVPFMIVVELAADGTTSSEHPDWLRHPIGPDERGGGSTRFHLTDPGRWRVLLHAELSTPFRRRREPLPCDPVVVDIPEGSANETPLEVEVVLGAAAIEAVASRWSGNR